MRKWPRAVSRPDAGQRPRAHIEGNPNDGRPRLTLSATSSQPPLSPGRIVRIDRHAGRSSSPMRRSPARSPRRRDQSIGAAGDIVSVPSPVRNEKRDRWNPGVQERNENANWRRKA
jgi:hypothetical protein